MTHKIITKRKFFIPEVVQTSAMDCGPATLKCLLEGYHIPISFGRLREACQTDVDGTSIDTMEEIANQLGLVAEQVILSKDSLFLKNTNNLPAIIVVRNPSGSTHFVVIWKKLGNYLQIMDPAHGRQWINKDVFLKNVYEHTQSVNTKDWLDWAKSNEFITLIQEQFNELGFSKKASQFFIQSALKDSNWQSLASLDAVLKLIIDLNSQHAFNSNKDTQELFKSFFEKAKTSKTPYQIIPQQYWSVRPDPQKKDNLLFTGAVLVRVLGRSLEKEPSPPPFKLALALKEKPSHSFSDVYKFLKKDGVITPAIFLFAALVAAFTLIIEILLFRALISIGTDLNLVEQRFSLIIGLVIFLGILFCLEFFSTKGFLALGRKLETRLRMAYLLKIPKLCYQYFNSRLVSDMAERCHKIKMLRNLPALAKRFVFVFFQIVFVALGLIWLYPKGSVLIVLIAIASFVIPLLLQPLLTERDLRERSHASSLRRFYLDSLLGIIPIRTHAASFAVRREHENLLIDWMKTKLSLEKISIIINGLQSLVLYALVATLLLNYLTSIQSGAGALIMVYWALKLPVLGQELALITKTYPAYKNIALRLFELLNVPEDNSLTEKIPNKVVPELKTQKAYAIDFNKVTVMATGHTLLKEIQLNIPAGSHIAIVGKSGAGKTSLINLLLGWYKPSQGQVLIDGKPLDEAQLYQLRNNTAWIDPGVQLWNKTFLENLNYGNQNTSDSSLDTIIQDAKLKEVLKALPKGLQTNLGESGALVSGGEGQRVRLARAMFRKDAKLVILDEPFRGLDRKMREELLLKARKLWKKATIICITHDIKETTHFDQVVMMKNGSIIEQGQPQQIVKDNHSHYAKMLRTENDILSQVWSNKQWRKIRIENGKVI